MASSVKSVRVKKVFDTPWRTSGICRLEMCVTEGSERSALHHSCAVKSWRCSTLSGIWGLIVRVVIGSNKVGEFCMSDTMGD